MYWFVSSFVMNSPTHKFSLKLLRTFYAEGLVDHRTFLVWIVQQMGSCNLAQAGFLTRLTEEYLDDILDSRALARPLVEACLSKMSEASIHHIFLLRLSDAT